MATDVAASIETSTNAVNAQTVSQVMVITPMMSDQVVSLHAGDDMVHVTAPGTVVQTGGSHTILSDHGGVTVNATGGNSVIYQPVAESRFQSGVSGVAAMVSIAA